jgi:hypothetical protein
VTIHAVELDPTVGSRDAEQPYHGYSGARASGRTLYKSSGPKGLSKALLERGRLAVAGRPQCTVSPISFATTRRAKGGSRDRTTKLWPCTGRLSLRGYVHEKADHARSHDQNQHHPQ